MSGNNKDDVDEDRPEKFLGRTLRSWCEITGFYIVYYCCLFGYWSLVYHIYLATDISSDKPTYVGMSSRIGAYPGIVVKPDHEQLHSGSKLYRLNLDFRHMNETLGRDVMGTLYGMDNRGYAARTQKIFRQLQSSGKHEKAVNCKMDGRGKVTRVDNNKELKSDEWCHFDPAIHLTECAEYPYGYSYEYHIKEDAQGKTFNKHQLGDMYDFDGRRTLSPCFLIKVNRLFETKLARANKAQMKHWPKELKDKIDGKYPKEKDLPHKMYINCKGQYPPDVAELSGKTWVARKDENMPDDLLTTKEVPKIEYFPSDQGIDLQYFPMRSKHNRENAYVAVKFNNIVVGHLTHVQCQAFYKDSDSDEAHKDDPNLGKVEFQIYIDDDEDYLFN